MRSEEQTISAASGWETYVAARRFEGMRFARPGRRGHETRPRSRRVEEEGPTARNCVANCEELRARGIRNTSAAVM